MSRHNRVRKQLWKLNLTKVQVGRKLSGKEIRAAKYQRVMGQSTATPIPRVA